MVIRFFCAREFIAASELTYLLLRSFAVCLADSAIPGVLLDRLDDG